MNELPELLDFWAPWCGPCRAMAPTIEALEKKLEGKMTVRRINVDEDPEEAQRYGIRSIPTLVLMAPNEYHAEAPGVEERLRIVGAKNAAALELEITQALAE